MAPLTSSAIIGAVAAFFGATGLIAALGFLVQQALFVLLGVPTPPFATIDYLRVAGYFLFDFVVIVVLLYGVLWGVIPALCLLVLFSTILALFPARVRTGTEFAARYGRAWAWIMDRWHRWFEGRVGLFLCLALLVVFTFAYHYPVFAQRGIALDRAGIQSGAECPTPEAVTSMWAPLRFGWHAVEARCAFVRRVIPVERELGTAQSIYTNGALFLLVLTVYVLLHPYSQFTVAGRSFTIGRRWLWSVNAVLVGVSLAYLPNGYGVLFRDKQAPHVRLQFKDDSKAAAGADWRDDILYKKWHLLYQNESEVWLYRAPHIVVLQKDQLAVLEIRERDWIFEQ